MNSGPKNETGRHGAGPLPTACCAWAYWRVAAAVAPAAAVCVTSWPSTTGRRSLAGLLSMRTVFSAPS
ncbi:hypothetical protein G6F40_018133 [Rhizopus arrhizus]|nr:hypothetical protein G6F40_018133 [Rhizopus arrhizus]KAG1471423.1 hypothetical protein G6F54_014495 [Rhizopus delemar]